MKVMNRVVAVFLAMCATMSAYAWGALGHQVVCDIAWRHSSVKIRSQLSAAAVRMGYKTFANSCVWPDRVRKQKRYQWMQGLHYLNVPKLATEVDLARDCSALSTSDKPRCLLTAIPYFLQQLTTADRQAQRDQALLLVAHFVADLHQPLHVAYKEDRGGNRVLLPLSLSEQQRWQNIAGQHSKRSMNIHYWWDTGVLACRGSQRWSRRGSRLYQVNIDQGNMEVLTSDSVLIWANESLQITRQFYADVVMQPLSSHCRQWQPLAEMRLQQAGYRLALLLKAL